MTGEAPKLRMSAICKTFPGVRALDDVSFETRTGEIVGLVGVNGAGKSTLMNILGGVTQPDRGKIFIDEDEIAIHSPKEAARHGISFIHQEPQFFASRLSLKISSSRICSLIRDFRSSSTRRPPTGRRDVISKRWDRTSSQSQVGLALGRRAADRRDRARAGHGLGNRHP